MERRRFIVASQPVRAEKAERARARRRRPTPAERLLWQALRGRQTAGVRFRRQQVIAGFIADFYCPATGLVVELDGPVHVGQQDADEARDAILAGMGLSVLHVPNADVQADINAVLKRIQEAMAEGG
jgi:very-short-patch-repair endonuclease